MSLMSAEIAGETNCASKKKEEEKNYTYFCNWL